MPRGWRLRWGSIPRSGPGAAVGVVLVWSGLLWARGKESIVSGSVDFVRDAIVAAPEGGVVVIRRLVGLVGPVDWVRTGLTVLAAVATVWGVLVWHSGVVAAEREREARDRAPSVASCELVWGTYGVTGTRCTPIRNR